MYVLLKRLKEQNAREYENGFVAVVKRKLQEFYRTEEFRRNRPAFKDNFKRKMAGQIEYEVMQKFELPVPQSIGREPNRQNRDFMRVLKVSDTRPLVRDALLVKEVQVLSLTKGSEIYLQTPIYAEVIPCDVDLSFTITLDEQLLKYFVSRAHTEIPFNSIEGVFDMVKEFSQDQWNYEKAYWEKVYGPGAGELRDFYNGTPGTLRMGWGSGMAGASLLMLLPEDIRRELRDALYQPRGEYIFPKSRRAVMEKGIPRLPLGWAILY